MEVLALISMLSRGVDIDAGPLGGKRHYFGESGTPPDIPAPAARAHYFGERVASSADEATLSGK
jgi:hypothetical protein